MTQHTPEPWEAIRISTAREGFPRRTEWQIISGGRGAIIVSICARDQAEQDEGEANVRKILSSVNACAGIEDPAAAIRAAREALIVAETYLGNDSTDDSPEAKETRKEIKKALSLLGKNGV